MRILLLSYHLHPDWTAEGLCVAKTARMLVDHGHQVEILTSMANYLAGESLIPSSGLLAGIRVHRVAAAPNRLPTGFRQLYTFTHRQQRRGGRGGWFWDKSAAALDIMLGSNVEDYSWARDAGDLAARLWYNHDGVPFDLLYSRLNHFVSHLAALNVVHQRPHIHWCAHFSDPWPGHLYPTDYRHKPTRSGLMERRQERILHTILDRAQSLTFPGDRLCRFLLSGSRERYRHKAHAIPHLGNFWDGRPAYRQGEQFNLVFAGFLLRQRSTESLFQGLQQFLTATPQARAAIRMQFIGKNTAVVEEGVQKYALAGVVSTAPQRGFSEVWPLLCQADVLLLIESPMAEGVFMPSKLADYLSAGRPILALSPPVGTVADFLSQGGGLRVDPDDATQIAQALQQLYALWQSHRLEDLAPAPSLIDRVSPACLAPLYDAAFHQALGKE